MIFSILGSMVGSYFFYIVLALIFKHKIGLGIFITTGILMMITSFFSVSFFSNSISIFCDSILIHFVKFFRVRDNSRTNNTQTNSQNKQSSESSNTTEHQK